MKKLLLFLAIVVSIVSCQYKKHEHRTAHVHCYQYTDPTTHLLLYYYMMTGNNGSYYYYSSTTQYTGTFTEISWQTSTTPPIDINDAENVQSMPDIDVLDDILPADIQENIETQEMSEPDTNDAPETGESESGSSDSGSDSGGSDSGGSDGGGSSD